MCAEPRARVRRLNIFGRCSVQPRALVYVCLAYWEESEMHHYENIWPPPLPPVARAHISLTAPKILQDALAPTVVQAVGSHVRIGANAPLVREPVPAPLTDRDTTRGTHRDVTERPLLAAVYCDLAADVEVDKRERRVADESAARPGEATTAPLLARREREKRPRVVKARVHDHLAQRLGQHVCNAPVVHKVGYQVDEHDGQLRAQQHAQRVRPKKRPRLIGRGRSHPLGCLRAGTSASLPTCA